MRIKGLTKMINQIEDMMTNMADKMDELEGDEEIYERYDMTYMELEQAQDMLRGIKEI